MVSHQDSRSSTVISTFPIPQSASDQFSATKSSLDIKYHEYQPKQENQVISTDEFKALIKEHSPDAVLLTLTTQCKSDVLDLLPKHCKVISTMSVGYDHIDVKQCTERGVVVGYTPDVLTETVADLALALTLATARKIVPAMQSVRDGTWGAWSPFMHCGKDLHSSTVGIVGCGRIGLAVARRLRGFGCKLLYHNRHQKSQAEEQQYGLEYCKDIGTLLKQSDFVIPQLSPSAATANMFNRELFAQMKPDAIFINTTRGSIVNQDELLQAVQHGTIGGAGLDVTTPEPLPADSPLLQHPNIVVFPHIGSATTKCRTEMMVQTATNIVHVLKGDTDKGYYVNLKDVQQK